MALNPENEKILFLFLMNKKVSTARLLVKQELEDQW